MPSSQRNSLLAILLAASTVALPRQSSAQALAVYGTFTPIHVSNAVNGNSSATLPSTPTTTSYWTPGVQGGVTLRLIPLGPAAIGLDVRGSRGFDKQYAETLFAGLKLSVKAPLIPFKPYIQASGGWVGSHAALTNNVSNLVSGTVPRNSFWSYEILGGIDTRMAPFVDLRPIEIGVGHGYYQSGATTAAPPITFFTLSTGIVFHL
jgi:hypothetical protein